MQLSTLVVALFAANAIGSPFDKRAEVQGNPEVLDVTVIDEVDYFVNGKLVSSTLSTEVTEETIYPSAAVAPSSVVTSNSAPAPSSTAAASSPTPKPTASLESATASAQPSAQSSAALTTGWVDPKTDPHIFSVIAVFHHNVHRTNHSVPTASWNQTLARWAQAKADICIFNEDAAPGAEGQGVGMNIAGGTYGSPRSVPGPSDMISGLWYNSELDYFPGYGIANLNTSDPLFQHWGHFTQLVWPTSVQIGCGLTDCGDSWFGACLYGPTGNWEGMFNLINEPAGNPIVYPNGQHSM